MPHLSKFEIGYDKNELLSRILDLNDYKIILNNSHRFFNINDTVVCFFNGMNWNIVSLYDMLAYPLLYYEYWSDKYKTYYINTLVVCPLTMRAMIYKGKIKIIDIIKDRLFLKNTDTDDDFFMDLPYTGHVDIEGKEKNIKSHVKRIEIKLLKLRDSFMFIIDPKYIVVNNKKSTLITEKYYNNRFTYMGEPIYTTFHPKTIVYMIQYYSFRQKKYKYACIVGNDIDKDNVTGYSYKSSGIWDFLTTHKNELIKKKAYIYPVFWFMIENLYTDVKMIAIEKIHR